MLKNFTTDTKLTPDKCNLPINHIALSLSLRNQLNARLVSHNERTQKTSQLSLYGKCIVMKIRVGLSGFINPPFVLSTVIVQVFYVASMFRDSLKWFWREAAVKREIYGCGNVGWCEDPRDC
jgi:hypothetical protein